MDWDVMVEIQRHRVAECGEDVCLSSDVDPLEERIVHLLKMIPKSHSLAWALGKKWNEVGLIYKDEFLSLEMIVDLNCMRSEWYVSNDWIMRIDMKRSES